MGLMSKFPRDRGCEILGTALLALTLFLFFALVSTEYRGVVPLDEMGSQFNLCGKPGAYVAGFLYILLGNAAHFLYFLTCLWALTLFRHNALDRVPLRLLGMLMLAASFAGLLQVHFEQGVPGGVIGAYVAHLLLPTFLKTGSYVITVTLCIVGVLLATEFLFVSAADWVYRAVMNAVGACYTFYRTWQVRRFQKSQDREERRAQLSAAAQAIRGVDRLEPAPRSKKAVPMNEPALSSEPPSEPPRKVAKRDPNSIRIVTQLPKPEPVQDEMPFDEAPEEEPLEPQAEPMPPLELPFSIAAPPEPELPLGALPPGIVPRSVAKEAAPPPQIHIQPSAARRTAPAKPPMPRRKNAEMDELPPDYVYPRRFRKPSLDMLDDPPPSHVTEDLTETLRETSVLLEKALETFGIEARVTDVTRGPTITRFELEPAPGIKVNRFIALADDLALALKAHGVRVEAPIPGKGRVGIELPNVDREPVMIRELLESRVIRKHKGKLVLALGKDIAGEVMAADLTTMPHLLIAGATGTGKTVCVKSILGSLLFTKTPEELQLMLVDPKMVELSIFNEIPHLITPVVTDPKKAASALNWLIVEMEERYRLFAQLRVRNIEVYNDSVENGEIEMPEQEDGTASESMDAVRKLPYIVCVIDELADLMMLARAEVEDAIMRLAQLARAVGIHLIIATQRPSVNVLTGVIKANFPVRISFQVSSRIDSRCILDEMGAERLIGRGDMLYLPAGKATPTRIQGAFVGDHEMNALIAYLKTQAPPQYRDEIASYGKTPEQLEELVNETDELFEDAVRVVLETGQASISMVQRRLRVGYTRAARLIDMMEVRGIVGPHLGSKAREILVDFAPADRNA